METWFLNHVLGLSLSVLLLGLPGPLGAGTPSNNSTDPATTGDYFSTVTDEANNTENSATSTAYSSESLSPSQRNLLLTHTAAETHTATAGNFDTKTQMFTETSRRSLETANLSTEPLTSTLIVATTEASSSSSSSRDWKDSINTVHVSNSSREDEGVRLPQDSSGTTLRLGDVTSFASQTSALTDSTYASTTISRAGERTLLSVTSSNNSTSSAFTEDSNSQHPPSTWGISRATETDFTHTHSATSTRTDSREPTNQQITHSFKGMSSETGSPEGSQGTQSLTGTPNATQHQHTSTFAKPSDSTPPLIVTGASTDQSEVPVSSTPALTSPTGGAANISGTYQESGSTVGNSTESSTVGHIYSTENQNGTESLSSQTRTETVSLGLTTVSPTVSSSTSEMSHSTVTPALVTEGFSTTAPVTEGSQTTQEVTASTSIITTIATTTPTTTTIPPLPATSSTVFSSTTHGSTPESHTSAIIPNTTPSTTVSTVTLQTSTELSTYSMPSSQTLGPSTGSVNPTDVTSPHTETTSVNLGVTTTRITTTYTHSPSTISTEAVHTTGTQTERRTTQQVVTTSPTDIQTKAPHLPNKTQKHSCPAGFICVSGCECPLGFDLNNGGSCTRAKTFLGTFNVSRLHHDGTHSSTKMLDEQILTNITQLLNVSLSVPRGYRSSTLCKREDDGVHILAVNKFSIDTDVMSAKVYSNIKMALNNCNPSSHHCSMAELTYQVESLCVAQNIQCDKDRSNCTDNTGIAYCQCHDGYYKHSPEDLSCLECRDGYKLENGTCVPCKFGFGGFNCENFYKLIALVVAPVGGVLLLILIITLVVVCCKKDKNDINKIIFKSGDLQMSPYADFPKNNRISMEWGRETIEMQENGSTKNLLQMTDIYYSPALRNSDLDRNGLYPFMGLPGSRHSCIYPAQWNPSFISDDSRRRDYF